MPLWTPADLGSAFAAGYRADQISEITQSGGTVSQWADWSGNARHLSQATATAQPTYGANALASGYPGLTTDGGDGLSATLGFSSGTVVHVFAVMINSSANGDGGRIVSLSEAGQGDTSSGILPLYSGTAGASIQAFVAGVGTVNSLAVTANTPFVAGFAYQSGQSRLWRNGTSGTAFTYTFPVSTFAELTVARSPSGTSPSRITLSELVLVTGTMTDDIRQKVEGYLAHKWGLQGNLPSDHPYKNAAPTTGSGTMVAIIAASASYAGVQTGANARRSAGVTAAGMAGSGQSIAVRVASGIAVIAASLLVAGQSIATNKRRLASVTAAAMNLAGQSIATASGTLVSVAAAALNHSAQSLAMVRKTSASVAGATMTYLGRAIGESALGRAWTRFAEFCVGLGF